MLTDLGERIVKLRLSGKSLRAIQKIESCSKSTVSKWCAIVRNNPEIIDVNTTRRHNERLKQAKTRRQQELLRSAKPDDPSWWNDFNARRREARRAYLLYAGGNCCQICGYNKCKSALTFHHIDQTTKNFALSGTSLYRSFNALLSEISKCCLLCHNCHIEVHSGINHSLIPIIPTTPPKDIIEWWLEYDRFESNKLPSGYQPDALNH